MVFPVQLTTIRPYPVDPYFCYMCDHAYVYHVFKTLSKVNIFYYTRRMSARVDMCVAASLRCS